MIVEDSKQELLENRDLDLGDSFQNILETIKVLLIDNDEDDYTLTRGLFSEVKVGKYLLDWAPSYEEGLKVAGRREHHVCMVNNRLGKRSGVQLIREARKSRLTTPMILLAGRDDHDVDVEAMQAGATGFLVTHEMSPALLERTIRYAVQLNTERSRTEEALGAYAQKQAVVAEIGRLALIGGELKDLFAEAVFLIARALGVEYCMVLELLPDRDALILRAGLGLKEEFLIGQSTVSASKETQAGFTLLSDEPVVVEDWQTETRFSGTPLLHEHGVSSGISVIIRRREHPYGVLSAHTTSVRRFAPDDVNFLRAVANVLAEAIDRKHSEDEVRQSDLQFRALFENALDAVLIANDQGVYVDANPAACELLGVSYDEITGRTICDFTEDDYCAEASHMWEQFLKDGRMHEEFRLQRPDRKVVEIDFTATANFLPGRHFSMLRDITERKRAEETLRQSEERYRLLFKRNPQPMWVFDLETLSFLEVNDAAIHHYGYSREEFLAMTIKDIRRPEDIPNLLASMSSATPHHEETGIWKHRKKDGTFIDVEIAAHQLTFYGRLAQLVLAFDVTERRTLEEQFRQSQKMEAVGRLAGGIAHDFNNLITVINGYSDLTLRRLDPKDPLIGNLEEIRTAGGRAATLTRQLLAFSRKQVLQPKVIDLNEVILDLEKMLHRLIGEDIDLRTALEPELRRVYADPGQIDQVIMNLAVNARDSMPDGGKLTIRTENVYLTEGYAKLHVAVNPGPYVMLGVSDNGLGMSAATKARLFEPFFTTKDLGKGTGLGLSTVYGIIKQSMGNIWVYSEVGLGTTFKVYLPATDEEVASKQSSQTSHPIALGSETVLLVEDDEMVRGLTRTTLEEGGYKVLQTANGAEALLICEKFPDPIHLLLTDVVMPGMSGRAVADRLKTLRPQMLVLYMSGYTEDEIVCRGVLNQGVNFIEKPFAPATLARMVRELLDA